MHLIKVQLNVTNLVKNVSSFIGKLTTFYYILIIALIFKTADAKR